MKSLLFSLSLIAYSLHAADDAQVRNLENRVAALEQRKNGGGVILPSAGANLDDDVGLSLDGELLIWKAHQTGMNYGQGYNANSTDTNPFLKPNFVFDPGVRLSGGLRPNHDDWQLDASWTFFYTKAKGHFDEASTSIVPLFQVVDYDSSTNLSNSLNSVWRVNLNIIDLDLSRASFMSKWMSVKPYISIRNMWLHQKYNLNAIVNSSYYNGNLRSNFWAIGPRAGFELKFGMGEGFYFFNNTSAALLWGYFKNSQDSNTAKREMYVHTSTYNVDMSLGLGWDRKIDDNHYRISLRGAWEHHIFFNTNFFQSSAHFDNFTAFDQANGNFTLEGFTFTVRFDF